MTTPTRDFLEVNPGVDASIPDRLIDLMMEQNDHLANIALYLRQLTADVLCSAVVTGVSQISNGITDARCHEVKFEVGNKPVMIYNLLAFSSWVPGVVGVSLVSMSKVQDGMQLASGDVLNINIPTASLWVTAPDATTANPLYINGPADPTNGGIFLYGFAVPDYANRVRRPFVRS